MKPNTALAFVALAMASTTLVGCQAIETIFKAGVWVGVVGVALVLLLIVGLTRLTRRS